VRSPLPLSPQTTETGPGVMDQHLKNESLRTEKERHVLVLLTPKISNPVRSEFIWPTNRPR
jgi:hypothetical protein